MGTPSPASANSPTVIDGMSLADGDRTRLTVTPVPPWAPGRVHTVVAATPSEHGPEIVADHPNGRASSKRICGVAPTAPDSVPDSPTLVPLKVSEIPTDSAASPGADEATGSDAPGVGAGGASGAVVGDGALVGPDGTGPGTAAVGAAEGAIAEGDVVEGDVVERDVVEGEADEGEADGDAEGAGLGRPDAWGLAPSGMPA